MFRYLPLTIIALVGATSCVPQRAPQGAAPQVAETRAPVLLRQLALDVPDDLAKPDAASVAQPLPPRVLPAAAPPFLAVTHSPDDAVRAMECLTEAVYYEARSESADGQRAVAQVVLNRVRDRAFPASVCDVVYQGSTRRTGCQFSFTCDGSMNHPRQSGAWDRARMIAAAALSGAVYAPVGSATFYHADYVLPWWAASMARIGNVGAHIFYRWRGAMENALAFRQPYSGSEPGRTATTTTPLYADGAQIMAEQELVSGVTIHRGGLRAVPATATPALAVAEAAPPKPRTLIVSGVRVHSGARMPLPVGTADAIVGEETDPI